MCIEHLIYTDHSYSNWTVQPLLSPYFVVNACDLPWQRHLHFLFTCDVWVVLYGWSKTAWQLPHFDELCPNRIDLVFLSFSSIVLLICLAFECHLALLTLLYNIVLK